MKINKIAGIFLTVMLLGTAFQSEAGAAENETYREQEAQFQELIYGIGSTSKVITAAAVMKLAGEDKIDLDRSLTAYIPEFIMADLRYREITPRMLLNHTSGIQGSTLTNAMLLGDADSYNHDTLLTSLRTQRLKADPGEYGTYCNDGFTLAEILVERVSGMSFSEYIERYFAAPLKLSRIRTPQNFREGDRLAEIYDGVTGGKLPAEYANVIGSGGIYTTAEELCKLSQIFMEDQNAAAGVLDAEAARSMQYSEYEEKNGIKGKDNTLSYGLGWDSVSAYPFNRYGIKALVKGGDTKAYHSSLTVLPEENIACAVLSSGGSSSYNQLAVQEILLEYLDEIGRIQRDREAEKSVKEADQSDTCAMPEELLENSGWYAGKALFRVQIESSGKLTLTSQGSGHDVSQIYEYRSDGRFYSAKGSYISSIGELSRASNGIIGFTALEFRRGPGGKMNLTGSIYETYPGLGSTALYLPIAEKEEEYPLDDKALAAWAELEGKAYYLVSEKYSSTAYLDQFLVRPKLAGEGGCYLMFPDTSMTMARIENETEARFFEQLPGQVGRDLNDYRITRENGVQYLETGSYRLISEDGIKMLPATDSIVKIGEDGEAVWFSSGQELAGSPVSIAAPLNGAYYIYDHGAKTMKCVRNSYLVSPGQQFLLPKDGRIVFAGDPGAEFTITVQDGSAVLH